MERDSKPQFRVGTEDEDLFLFHKIIATEAALPSCTIR
jgi:hypothetical protein